MTPPVTDARIEELLAHSAWIRSLARKLVGDPAIAEDLLQRTLVAALERPPGDVHRGPPLRRWLAAVLRNFARQERRAEGRRSDHEQRAARPEALPSTLDVVARASVQREVVEAVLSLAEPYRTTILLRFFDGLPPRAIARRTGVPVDTVRTRIARGVARLRERLDESRSGDRAAWLSALIPLAKAPTFPLSTALGVPLVNAKIQIAAAVLVAGGALTYFLATRSHSAEAGVTSSAAVPVSALDAETSRSGEQVPALSEAARAQERSGDRAPAQAASAQPVPPAVLPATLHGRVIDDRGGPVSGVRIVLQGDKERSIAEATSGPAGDFEVPFQSGGGGRLLCADPRFATVLAGVSGGDAKQSRPVVVVARRVEVSGRVFGEEGFALDGARVEVVVPEDLRTRVREVLDRSASMDFSAKTDEAGSFTIQGAPRVEGALLRASHDGYTDFSGPIEEHSGVGLTLTLARPRSDDGFVRGKVVDGAGRPVDDAQVAFGVDLARTEEDGSFSFVLSDPKSVSAQIAMTPKALVAAKKGHLPARYEAPLVAGVPSWPANVLLRLGETPLAIEGRVVDHKGEGVSDAIVWLADATFLGYGKRGPTHLEDVLAGQEGKAWRRIEADGDGRFRIGGLLQRDYRLRAMDAKTLLIAEEGPFPAGAQDVELRLRTDQLYPKVAGRVLSHAGKPVARARIFPMCDAFQVRVEGQIFGTSHEDLEGTKTDSQGRFELENVPKSLVYLRVEGDEILPLEYGRYVEGDPRFVNTVRGLPTDKIADLEIVVDTRCHLQVELADPSSADALAVLDAEGRALTINIFVGNGRREDERAAIVDGRSYPMALSDAGRTLVLYSGDLEISRMALELVPGEMKQVRL